MRAGARPIGFASVWQATQATFRCTYVSATDGGGDIAERYKKALPKANIGKCCVRFKRLSDLDQAALKKMLHECAMVSPQAYL